ncbi:RluA family pseudouridine synthase [Lihuaxuella thermophila]|uniref:Pseudouridine synthase n=1 Tax=Lihuaxuella thermophila TaxID=1173111 RepID=A0A1H8EDP9_9BACL|nr:RluA family pseudouridine synthase [Lihuaxuella thermophila]SEN16947.1 23S rRNA pseudouridine1911/1915/1917 synthase [Lihuaxuella thermophila]
MEDQLDLFERYEWEVSGGLSGERLDKAVSSRNEDWSRVRVQEWIKSGLVLVNGRAKKGNYRLKEGEMIEVLVPPAEELQVEAEPIPLDIRYEDEDVLVVNKPRGMVVHPGPGNYSGTLVNALLAHCKEDLSGIGGVARPGIVHRIDKDTSGLLMVAKNDRAHQSLVAQLKEHSVERVYVAVVHGVIPHENGTIDAPIGRDPAHRQRMAVIHKNSKHAVTHFTVRERFSGTTLVECRLETGRTHQIRVHMKYIGFPLVGDPVYGPKKNAYPIEGQALHAQVIGFTHPRTGERIRIEAELPEDMERLLHFLRARQ